jgi:hypothetical protein
LSEKALSRFQTTIQELEGKDKKERTVGCLLLPRGFDGDLTFEEVMGPDMLELAQSASDIITEFTRNL